MDAKNAAVVSSAHASGGTASVALTTLLKSRVELSATGVSVGSSYLQLRSCNFADNEIDLSIDTSISFSRVYASQQNLLIASSSTSSKFELESKLLPATEAPETMPSAQDDAFVALKKV